MKKSNFMAGWLLYVFLLTLPLSVSSQIAKRLSVNPAEIERKNLKKGGKDYEKIFLKEAYFSCDVGKPGLPVYYYTFYVPKGQSVTDVSLKSLKQQEIQLNADLLPAQHPVPVSLAGIDTSFDTPDAKVYASDAFYPDKQATVIHTDLYDGDIQLVTIEIYPIQYHPKQRKLKVSADFDISLATGSAPKSASTHIISKNHDKKSIGIVKSLVQNPQDVSSVETKELTVTPNALPNPTNPWSVPFYEYVVITTRTLKPAFTEFVAWKKRKGYNVGIVCIEDILADPMASGDDVSGLYDDAGKLRQYLAYGYQHFDIKYVLLGGDNTVVPIRYGDGGDIGTSQTWANGMAMIPSDLYFSDFNTNWSAGSDPSRTGTYYSGFDYGSEIFVGRLLCNSESDVTTWTNKILLYEQNPGNGDYSYLSKALFTEADYIGTINPGSLPSVFTTKTLWSELPSDDDDWPYFPKGADVITELNNNYGLYSNFNHGGTLGFGTATHGNALFGHDVHYAVTAMDAYDDDDDMMYSTIPEPVNAFNNLTNTNYPTLIYSISCINMPFDNYAKPDATNNPMYYPGNIYNLGKSFTAINQGGGPVYLGNTRDGWTISSHSLFTNFLNRINTNANIGIAEANSKIGFYDHWVVLAHNLIGCPETPMWTALPAAFDNVTISESGTDVTVSTGVPGSTIILTMLYDDFIQGSFVAYDVSDYTFPGITMPYMVTITKPNYIPYQQNPTDVYLQDVTAYDVSEIEATRIYAGSNVTDTKPQGPVVIQNGASVIFDVTQEVNLYNGFEIQLGGTLEIK